MACKSGCFALQKCRFWSVRATLSQSKIIYFTNSFLFYRFLFLYFTLFSCVKFIAPFTGFQNNKYELPKCKYLTSEAVIHLFRNIGKRCKMLSKEVLQFRSNLFASHLALK